MRINLGQEIKTIEIGNEVYPRRLKKIADAPKTLYYRIKRRIYILLKMGNGSWINVKLTKEAPPSSQDDETK